MIQSQNSEGRFERRIFEASLIAKALSDPEFRRHLIDDPKRVYSEQLDGFPIPEEVELKVVEEKGNLFYIVLPHIPSGEDLNSDQIEAIAQRRLTHREPCWGVGDGLQAAHTACAAGKLDLDDSGL